MKSVFCLSVALFSAQALAAHPSRVSVLRFDPEVDHVYEGCRGWVYDRQDQLRTQMEAELSRQGLRVLERRAIRQIHQDEFELPNINKKSVARRNGFLAAQYSVTGAVTELGICESSRGGGVQLGGIVSLMGGPSDADLKIGGHSSSSKVTLAAQVVDVETGEILKSFSAKSEVENSGVLTSAGAMGLGAKVGQESAPPIESATNRAISDLAGQIASFLMRQKG
jgi:curli biogenesis system outer membrane secretion channel CsgG